jgi:hypothetical protein
METVPVGGMFSRSEDAREVADEVLDEDGPAPSLLIPLPAFKLPVTENLKLLN